MISNFSAPTCILATCGLTVQGPFNFKHNRKTLDHKRLSMPLCCSCRHVRAGYLPSATAKVPMAEMIAVFDSDGAGTPPAVG